MTLTADHPTAEKVVVLLNNRPIKCWIAANDEEGWVDIPDIASMAPLTEQSSDSEELEAWEEVPVKRLQGNVSFHFIGSK